MYTNIKCRQKRSMYDHQNPSETCKLTSKTLSRRITSFRKCSLPFPETNNHTHTKIGYPHLNFSLTDINAN